MSTGAGYYFLPWVRFGVLANATTPDTFDATLQPHLQVPVKLRVNDAPANDVSMPFTVYGPGDVIGIDAREIVRTVPRHLTPDFPPNLFASVEFDRPDFPWLFTPASAGTGTRANRLRPWIVLAVVRKAVATITVDLQRPLPILRCPSSELPDLAESWLWAHGMYTGALDGASVTEQLAARPQQSTSRLLCPRQLERSGGGPDCGYYACVVPAFEVGRKAGLDEAASAADATSLRPAWDVTAPGPVQLPVYYHWEFNTGPDGDFEDAVKRLEILQQPPAATFVQMDASTAGGGMSEYPGMVLRVSTALRPAGQAESSLPANFDQLRQQLRAVVESPPGTGERVPPPIYGRWQATGAGVHGQTPLAAGAAPTWLADLNTDPRRRAAAALGARVVQQQQEQLVASAWEQAGDVRDVNQWLRQKQLGREVTRSVYDKRLTPLSDVALQQIAEPIAIGVTTPAARSTPRSDPSSAGSSRLAGAVVSPAFRRMTRPLGPLSRQRVQPLSRVFEAAEALESTTGTDAGAASMRALVEGIIAGRVDDLDVAPQPRTVPASPSSGEAIVPAPAAMSRPRSTAPLFPAADAVRTQFQPDATFAAEAQARVQIPSGAAAARPDPLSSVLLTPVFPQPMYEPLRDLFAQMLLPGVDSLPNNSVMLLEMDPGFIEAYMAGLNDEMSRELLWREFPTDLRGTYFRQFWDVRGQLPPEATESAREALRDIAPIAQWQVALGSNTPAARRASLLFLLLKGDLLTRFPSAVIYAGRGAWAKTSSGADVQVVDGAQPPVMPRMHVVPAPGVTLLGFSLVEANGSPVTAATVAGATTPAGSPGWFFVIEEHPTEPRFGLDSSASPLTTWRELAWPDIQTRGDGSKYIAAAARVPALVAPAGNAPQAEKDRYLREITIPWAGDAGAMAYITLQQPFRQEIHASYWFLRPDAAFVRQTVPAAMLAGQSYEVSLTFRNAGTATWVPGGPNPFRLGSLNPEGNLRWGSNRREVIVPVAPGAEVTFAFMVIAPPAGTYNFQWRMLQEPVQWFGAPTPNVVVTVSATPSASVYERDLGAGIGGAQL